MKPATLLRYRGPTVRASRRSAPLRVLQSKCPTLVVRNNVLLRSCYEVFRRGTAISDTAHEQVIDKNGRDGQLLAEDQRYASFHKYRAVSARLSHPIFAGVRGLLASRASTTRNRKHQTRNRYRCAQARTQLCQSPSADHQPRVIIVGHLQAKAGRSGRELMMEDETVLDTQYAALRARIQLIWW